MYDLVLRNGRLLDPAEGLDLVADLAFQGGKIARIAPGAERLEAAEIRDVAGALVVPGLIDLHTHVYWGGTSLGVDAERIAARSGTTTFVDAGSAGAGNLAGFRAHVIEEIAGRGGPRILAYLNISFAGIFGFSKTVMVGECSDMRLVSADDCLAAARANRDIIVGIKARIGARAGGLSGLAPLTLAIEVADALGLPVMAHIDFPPPSQREVLEILRPGDVLTHCFRPFPNAPMRAGGQIRDEVRAALKRGVVFDIGHGYGGFSFASARAMLAEGIAPHVLSSDVHVLCVDGPAFDLLAVMSKFLALGMTLPDVIRATTTHPARAIARPDLGCLREGAAGDATILTLEPRPVTHVDVVGETIQARDQLACAGLVIGGRIWQGGARPG